MEHIQLRGPVLFPLFPVTSSFSEQHGLYWLSHGFGNNFCLIITNVVEVCEWQAKAKREGILAVEWRVELFQSCLLDSLCMIQTRLLIVENVELFGEYMSTVNCRWNYWETFLQKGKHCMMLSILQECINWSQIDSNLVLISLFVDSNYSSQIMLSKYFL